MTLFSFPFSPMYFSYLSKGVTTLFREVYLWGALALLLGTLTGRHQKHHSCKSFKHSGGAHTWLYCGYRFPAFELFKLLENFYPILFFY